MAEAAKRARAGARGWLTRASNDLYTVLRKETLNAVEINDAIDEFDKRLVKLDDAQSKVEVELNLDELESEIDEAADFRKKSRVPRVLACAKLEEMLPNKQSNLDQAIQSNSSTIAPHSSVEANLPKIELSKFDGNAIEWPSFWDQFEAVIHSTELPEITKFTYLQSLLTGEAKNAIKGLSLTSEHYSIACDILKQRFGREERIIFAHIQELLNITIPKQYNVSVLWTLQDELLAHVRSLEAMHITGEQFGVILTPLILSRLPSAIRLEWARVGAGHESDLDFLLKFLEGEIKSRERSQIYTRTNGIENASNESSKSPKSKVPTATALQTSSTDPCGFCGKRHPSHKCWDVTKLPIVDRKEKIKSAGMCFKCLSKKHIAKDCNAKCAICKGRHNVLICYKGENVSTRSQGSGTQLPNLSEEVSGVKSQAENTVLKDVSHVGVTCNVQNCGTSVVLQVLRIPVSGKSNGTVATVLFDTGSDRSYVSSSLIEKINPKWVDSEEVAYAAFGSSKTSKCEARNVYAVNLKNAMGLNECVFATEVPVICAALYRPQVPKEVLQSFGDIEFIENYSTIERMEVDLLIGLDYYWKFIKSGIKRGPDGLVAQETIFGWIVSGKVSAVGTPLVTVSHQLLCLQDVSENMLQKFWNLDSVGVGKDCNNLKHPVLESFEENISYSNGRYEVALPWKSGGVDQLLNNEKIANRRLEGQSIKLSKNPQLLQQYNDVIQQMEDSGVIEQVPEEEYVSAFPTYYMPHRPVVRESSSTTRIRPVFDASCKGYNGTSLNDCLETGPCLLPNLTAILIRFRRWLVAVTADISKAFLQIKVRNADRDVHRFLWKLNGETRVMRFTRVPFGNKSSPFLLNATIQHHLAKFAENNVVSELKENMYVDDFLSGSDNDEDACSMMKEATDIMAQAGMTLAKFGSNSTVVSQMLSREFNDKSQGENIKVLGMKWLVHLDVFYFDGLDITTDGLVVTKRVILSAIARLFDPLGFLTPYVMTAKCLFQDIWRLGLEWDEEVPLTLQQLFVRWLDGLTLLKSWQIRRSYTGTPWRDIICMELHGFGDSSEKGYGGCVYLKSFLANGSCTCSLVIAKARVAPVKKVTLPRLELMGALLCSRLVKFVKESLHVTEETRCYYWTDSLVVLSWIKSDPCKWKAFVANRVAEIHEVSSPSQWYHCPGKDNPADLLTRGVLAEDLLQSTMWLNGPQFLSCDSENLGVGSDNSSVEVEQSVVQLASNCCVEESEPEVVLVSGVSQELFDLHRWGTFDKCIQIAGWVLRFIHNLRSLKADRLGGSLSLEELTNAKHILFKYVQEQAYAIELKALRNGQSVPKGSPICKLDPFIDSDGFIKVQGRLQFADLGYDEKHPIILPKGRFTLLFVQYYHSLLKHAGVNTLMASIRCHYWIVGLRRLAKRVKANCVSCQRQDSRPLIQRMAPLPKDRVNPVPAFSIVGIDHAGPLYCCDFPGHKFYILLITCASVRAIHLELVNSLSANDCLLALRRFWARRGIPKVIYSDNAKTFKATQAKILRQLGCESPEWKYIAPRSPWWGGWWERLVGSVKSSLRKSLSTTSLTKVELETNLIEIEACINSRPLTYVGDEPDTGRPLTPSHFILGRGVGLHSPFMDETNLSTSRVGLSYRWQYQNEMLDRFWDIWSKEYIRQLPPYRGSQIKNDLKKGTVVLIREDGSPRLLWPMGIIQNLFQGKDGNVRAVELKTKSGLLTRPIQRLYRFEVNSDSLNEPDVSLPENVSESRESEKQRVSRFGRVIKPVNRLDL